jgi:predicted ATPase
MTLLERDAHFEELASHLRQAIGGCGRIVLIGGEAGVGKSALVEEFCERHRSSARVIRATCDSLSTPGPLGPLLDIGPALGLNLEQMLRPNQRRDELFHAVLSALRARDEPVIIVGEDAHWSDEASIDLLRFLSRRIDTLSLLFLVTYRDDELGPFHPLRRLMGDLASIPTLHRLTLSPLSEGAVRTLAAGTTHDPADLYRRTGGNPFFVTEVLAANRPGVPQTVGDAVLARAARLSPEARAVLDVSSVIGSAIEADLLMRVAGPVVEAMEECIAGGLLRQYGDGLAFRHELSRDAILATIAAPRRRLLHQRVLAALRANPASTSDYARLAHHAEAAGDVPAIREFATAAAVQASANASGRSSWRNIPLPAT